MQIRNRKPIVQINHYKCFGVGARCGKLPPWVAADVAQPWNPSLRAHIHTQTHTHLHKALEQIDAAWLWAHFNIDHAECALTSNQCGPRFSYQSEIFCSYGLMDFLLLAWLSVLTSASSCTLSEFSVFSYNVESISSNPPGYIKPIGFSRAPINTPARAATSLWSVSIWGFKSFVCVCARVRACLCVSECTVRGEGLRKTWECMCIERYVCVYPYGIQNKWVRPSAISLQCQRIQSCIWTSICLFLWHGITPLQKLIFFIIDVFLDLKTRP